MKNPPIPPPEVVLAAQRGAHSLPRALWALVIIEVVATTLRQALSPAATPVVLADVAAIARLLATLWIAASLRHFAPLAALHRLTPHLRATATLVALAALVPFMRFFAIVPDNLSEPDWDSALLGAFASILALATGGTAWLLRQLALAQGRIVAARRFAVAGFALVPLVPLGLFAADPTLAPHPALAAGLVVVVPWLLTAGGVARSLRPHEAAWLSLVTLSATLLPAFYDLPLLACGLALALGGGLMAYGLTTSVQGLGDDLSGRQPTGPSATFLRRLVAGPLGGEGSRVGDLPVDSRAEPGVGDASDAEASLALAYRELGIEAPPASREAPPARNEGEHAAAMAPGGLPVLPDNVVPFIPKSRQQARPPDPVGLASHGAPSASAVSWGQAGRGARRLLEATLGLTLLVAFSALLALTPLGEAPVARTLHALLLATLSLLALMGVRQVLAQEVSRPPSLRAAPIAFALSAALALALAVDGALDLDLPLSLPLTLTFIAAFALTAHGLGALAPQLDEARLSARARTVTALSSTLFALAIARHVLLDLDASDLQWLAMPLGFVSIGVFLAAALSASWLIRDTQIAIERAEARAPAPSPRPVA